MEIMFAIAAGIVLGAVLIANSEVLWGITWLLAKFIFGVVFFVGLAIITG